MPAISKTLNRFSVSQPVQEIQRKIRHFWIFLHNFVALKRPNGKRYQKSYLAKVAQRP